MDNYNLYKDIKARTNGEIYIGVVGPVRTGKSTFIKEFINQQILPKIEDNNAKERLIDELPQSATGKTVMTTEPKFIPKEAVDVELYDGIKASFKLIDSVGYLIEDVNGVYEEGKERLVKTPWFTEDIPFTQAAEYGTTKVIKDHSTIGIVVTTDGTITEIPRENYLEAEEKTIYNLKKLNKPFIVIVNSTKPEAEKARNTVKYIEEKYKITAISINCKELKKNDIVEILNGVLNEFPVNEIAVYMPKWVELQNNDSPIKSDIISQSRKIIESINCIKDIKNPQDIESKYINRIKFDNFDFNTGIQKINITIDEKFYYENLSELCGTKISDEYELIKMIKELSVHRTEYNKYSEAIDNAMHRGYGVVMPQRTQIEMSKPEIIKNGNKYGVKIKAQSPSIHMIKVDIETEIAPIVGSEEQAKDLAGYIESNAEGEGAWETNIFGKSVGMLIEEGIYNKLMLINDSSQQKLQDTMQKVVNETTGGIVCLII